jgi:hypothetical protein
MQPEEEDPRTHFVTSSPLSVEIVNSELREKLRIPMILRFPYLLTLLMSKTSSLWK